jgi:hypothetical protein
VSRDRTGVGSVPKWGRLQPAKFAVDTLAMSNEALRKGLAEAGADTANKEMRKAHVRKK